MTNKVIYFLLLGTFLTILSCSKDENDTVPDPTVPETKECVIQKAYRNGAIVNVYEVVSSTIAKKEIYKADTIFRTIITEKYIDGKYKERTSYKDGVATLHTKYIYTGDNLHPDTVISSLIDNTYSVAIFSYNGTGCNFNRIEYYNPSGTMYAFVDRTYSGENCNIEGASYSVEDGIEVLNLHYEYIYEDSKSPFLGFLLPEDNPLNLTYAKHKYPDGSVYITEYSYKFDTEGYPISSTSKVPLLTT